ncbi:MAG: VPLPA-CTERM sorting domain-containing protein [Pseudomonadota bacterium]
MNIKALAIASLMALATPLTAGAVTFEFGQGADNQNTLSFSQDGIGLNVFGFNGNGTDLIDQSSRGLGIVGAPEGGELGLGEVLVLEFDREVFISDATIFELGAEAESFTISTNTGFTADFTIGAGAVGAGAVGGFHSLSDLGFNTLGGVTQIAIAGLAPQTPGEFLGVRLSNITVSAVPLPASLALLLSAIAGLGFVARRRRAAA